MTASSPRAATLPKRSSSIVVSSAATAPLAVCIRTGSPPPRASSPTRAAVSVETAVSVAPVSTRKFAGSPLISARSQKWPSGASCTRVSLPSTTCCGSPSSGTASSKRGSIRDSCSTTSTSTPISTNVLPVRSRRPSAGRRRTVIVPSTPSAIATTAASSSPERGTSLMLCAS